MGSRLKRSKTPSPSSAPPEPIFFVDRDLGRRFPEMLRGEGLQVEIHDDHYPGAEKPPDHVWLQMAAERGWVRFRMTPTSATPRGRELPLLTSGFA